jgi:hypothetical protein
VAALQNAAGNFETPTAASLDAAVAVATPNADGTITPNYTDSSAAAANAYPMPDVIYAAVSTAPVPAGQASAETTLLTQMLQLTGTGGSNLAQLPRGFVPLPQALVTQAQSEIVKDIVAAPTPPTSPSGGGSGATGKGGSTSTSTPGPSYNLGPSGLLGGAPSDTLPYIGGISPLAGVLANSLAKAAAGSSSHGPTGPLLGPALPAYALAANQGNTVVTLAWILGLIALLAGLVLLSSGVLTRIRGARAAASVDEPGGDGPEVPAAGAAPA